MRVLTENEVRNLSQRIERGGTFPVPPGTLVTPMARDYLHGRGIALSNAEQAAAAAPSPDDALIAAVAEEVARALRPETPSTQTAEAGAEVLTKLPQVLTGGDARPTDPAPARAGGGRAVVWAIGGDRPGLLAAVAELLGRRKVNILEISQTILSGVFAMVVIVDLGEAAGEFAGLKAELEQLGKGLGINLSAQRDEIFQYMHRI